MLDIGLREPQKVQTGCGCGSRAKVLVGHFAAKSQLLQIVEAGRALDIGERFHRRDLQPLVHLAAGQRPPELLGKFIQMTLDHAVHVEQPAQLLE